mmetsp:Transcript_28068/g.36702  ORF Transcript_28068/g.36702 Transcript_28068/m.36702 type:complete len:301 (+) Transcript_28068:97-999(+)
METLKKLFALLHLDSFVRLTSGWTLAPPRTISSSLLSQSSLAVDNTEGDSAMESFVLHVDQATLLTEGGFTLPPMSEVPCTGPLSAMVKPPNVDDLYDWYMTKELPDADPSWGVVWPTAVSLSNYLVNQPQIVVDKKCVELGSGLALCGLTSAKLGATSVVISDREPYALHCALSTASVNNITTVEAAVIDWTDESSMVNSAEVIMASDVLYEKETIEAFATACKRISMNNKTCTLIVADPKVERTPGAREALRCALGENVQLDIVDLPLPEYDSPSQTVDGKDHELRMQEPTVLIKCTL